MGKALSIALRPLKNYNVQSRAHKVLDAEQVRPSPRYPAERQLDEAFKFKGSEKLHAKDDKLANNLKSVYVSTQDDATTAIAKDSMRGGDASAAGPDTKRPLPSYRRVVDHPPLGYVEPDRVPAGKVSLMRAIEFIMAHQGDPKKFTPAVIARDHRLDEEVVVSVLGHFSAFELHLPRKVGGDEETGSASVVSRIAQMPKRLVPESPKVKDQDP